MTSATLWTLIVELMAVEVASRADRDDAGRWSTLTCYLDIEREKAGQEETAEEPGHALRRVQDGRLMVDMVDILNVFYTSEVIFK